MNYYAFNIIKGNMNQIFLKKKLTKEEKEPFNQLTNLKTINDLLGFDKIHIGAGEEIRNLFDEDQLEKINLHLVVKNKDFLIPPHIISKALYKEENVLTFEYKNPEDLEKARIEAMKSPMYVINKLKEEAELSTKRAILNSYGDVLDVNLKGKTYLAIDFEFIPRGMNKFDIKNITEIGLSYINNGDIRTEHYIVEEHVSNKSEAKQLLQNSFNFGESTHISTADVRHVLETALSKSENLVFHEHSGDLRYFEYNKINLDQHRIYDTQIIYKNHLIPEGEPAEQGKTLKRLLNDNMIVSKNTHNAGNDSHYTAMLFKVQVNDVLALARKKNHVPSCR
jgi:hypothetical protein